MTDPLSRCQKQAECPLPQPLFADSPTQTDPKTPPSFLLKSAPYALLGMAFPLMFWSLKRKLPIDIHQAVATAMQKFDLYRPNFCQHNVHFFMEALRKNSMGSALQRSRVLILQHENSFIQIEPQSHIFLSRATFDFHTILEIDGRIYDFDFSGPPGLPIGDYLKRNFGDTPLMVTSLKPDLFDRTPLLAIQMRLLPSKKADAYIKQTRTHGDDKMASPRLDIPDRGTYARASCGAFSAENVAQEAAWKRAATTFTQEIETAGNALANKQLFITIQLPRGWPSNRVNREHRTLLETSLEALKAKYNLNNIKLHYFTE